MLNNSWFKKERPILGMLGFGGGSNSNFMHTAGGGVAPTWTATGGNATYPSVNIGGVNYKIHKFTSPGNFVITPGSGAYDVIVIAGGGSGGVDNGGGGGAGGVVDATVPSAVAVNGTWGVTVGGAGAARPGPSDNGSGFKGSNTTFEVTPTITLTADGGGAGSGWAGGVNGGGAAPGGSGGGNAGDPANHNPIGPGSATQPGSNPSPWATDLGNAGGQSYVLGGGGGANAFAGGGGGAGGAGTSGSSGTAGYGGLGYLTNGKYGTNPTGLDEYPSGRIAGGGTGGFDAANGTTAPPNLNTSPNPHNGVSKQPGEADEPACAANTGGGGHGANHDNCGSGAGGTGVVIVRYVA